jgi:hypothetical protein
MSFEICHLRISDVGSYITVYGKPELISLGRELEKILKDRQRKWYFSFFNSFNSKNNLIVITILSIGFWIYSKYKETDFNFRIWVSLFVFWLLILLYSELNPITNSKIELVKKHEISFYQRNKDKILIGIVMAILGALITLFIKK